jgi:hypothetical protein
MPAMVDTVADDIVRVRGGARAAWAPPAISWGSIFGGAVAAAATALMFLALGSGVGLSSISAWPGRGISAATFGVASAVWLIVVQWASSALGGYLAGRLRTKSVGLHTDEVFFRDTAHGFLSWATSVVIGVALLAAVTSWAAGEAARGAGAVTAGAASGIAQGASEQGGGLTDPLGYLVDTLFRSPNPANANPADTRAEIVRILGTDLKNGDVPENDKAYLAQLVSARTGLSQADAEARVNDVITKAKAAAATARQDADAARKATAYASFFMAFALLIGAFVAAAGGALGGQHRDEV